MSEKTNVPKTFQEYAAENQWGEEERSDKTVEEYYNKLAELLNQFSVIDPAEFEDTEMEEGLIDFDLTNLMDFYVSRNAVSRDVADRLICLVEEEILSLGAEYGFLWDLVLETFLSEE